MVVLEEAVNGIGHRVPLETMGVQGVHVVGKLPVRTRQLKPAEVNVGGSRYEA